MSNYKPMGQEPGRLKGKKYDKETKTQINLWLEPNLLDDIDKIADTKSTSRSLILRAMLRDGVRNVKFGRLSI